MYTTDAFTLSTLPILSNFLMDSQLPQRPYQLYSAVVIIGILLNRNPATFQTSSIYPVILQN